MEIILTLLTLVVLAGCSQLAPSPPSGFSEVIGTETLPVTPPETLPPMKYGLSGEVALKVLDDKQKSMSKRIDTEKAAVILSKTKSDMDRLNTGSNIVAGTTMAVGGIVATSAKLAAGGGVVTAILGGIGLYIENQRGSQDKIQLTGSCLVVLQAGPDVIDRYYDKWNINFRKYGASYIPDSEISEFNDDTDKTNDKNNFVGWKMHLVKDTETQSRQCLA